MAAQREPIRFAKDLSFPIDLVTQRVAVLGTSGGGKTYGAGVLVEGLVEAGAQVVVVDGIGIWYGLRLAKNGKSAGLSIPVFGGEHGDIPLEHTAGAMMAKLVAEKKLSMVLDVSDMNGADQRRFVTDFAVALHRAKKASRSPVMVVWEECQDFIPQRVSGDVARMVGAMEKLIKQGRNYGVGSMLISQRPQAVNKDALNQCGVLLAFQTIGTHERKAIKDWVVHQGVEQMTQLNELPSMPVGTCFVWSPGWLKVFQRVKVLEKRTLDTSRAPEFGDAVVARELPPVEMDELRRQMAATIEKAKADDPKLLRERIAVLERDLKKAQASKPEAKVERVEVPVWDGVQINLLELVASNMVKTAADAATVAKEINAALQAAAGNKRASLSRPVVPSPSPRPVVARVARQTPTEGEAKLGKCERALLHVLATRDATSMSQLAVLSGYSIKSSSFANALGALRSRGLADGGGDLIRITEAGMGAAGDVEPLPTGSALADYWKSKLGLCERTLLAVLIDQGPQGQLTKEELAIGSGYSVNSSSFANALGKLRTLQLAQGRGAITASASLFDGGA